MPTVTRTFRHQNGTLARDTLVVVRDATLGVVVGSDQTNSDGLFACWLEPGSYVFDVMGVSIPFTVSPGGELPPSGNYVHTQSTPAAQWTVTHNLGVRKPCVIFLSDEPTIPVETEGEYLNDNTTILIWPFPVSGTAHF